MLLRLNRFFVAPKIVHRHRFLSSLPPSKPLLSNVTGEKETKKADVKSMLPYYKKEKNLVAAAIGTLTASTAITLCVPAGFAMMIDAVQAGQIDRVSQLAQALGALFVTGAGINVWRIASINILGERITAEMRSNAFSALMSRDLSYFDTVRTGDLVSRISSDTTVIGAALSTSLSQGTRSTFQAIGGIGMMFWTCPDLALWLALFLPPTAVAARVAGGRLKAMATNIQTELGEAVNVAEERLANMASVFTFGQQHREESKFKTHIGRVLVLSEQRSWLNGVFFGSVDLALKCSLMAGMCVSPHQPFSLSTPLLSVRGATSFSCCCYIN